MIALGYFLLGLASIALVSCSKPVKDFTNPNPGLVHEAIAGSEPSASLGQAKSSISQAQNSSFTDFGFVAAVPATKAQVSPSVGASKVAAVNGNSAGGGMDAFAAIGIPGSAEDVKGMQIPPSAGVSKVATVINSVGKAAASGSRKSVETVYKGEWVKFVKKEFDLKRPGSFVFDAYMGFLLEDAQSKAEEDGENFKNIPIDPKKVTEDNQKTVFGMMLDAHTAYQNDSGFNNLIENEQGKEETVQFVTTFNVSYEDLVPPRSPPDRVVILGIPYMESNNFFYRKGNNLFPNGGDPIFSFIQFDSFRDTRQEVMNQMRTMISFVNYVQANQIPVHIMGKCDYFCSAYLLPVVSEIIIEPIGEVVFNGDLISTANTFNDVLDLLIQTKWEAFQEAALDSLAFAKLMREKFDIESIQDFFNSLSNGTFLVEQIKSLLIVSPLKRAAFFQTAPEDVRDAVLQSLRENNLVSLRKIAGDSEMFAQLITKNSDSESVKSFIESPDGVYFTEQITSLFGKANFQDFPDNVLEEFVSGMPLQTRQSMMAFFKEEWENKESETDLVFGISSASNFFRIFGRGMEMRAAASGAQEKFKKLSEFYRIVGLLTRDSIIDEVRDFHNLPIPPKKGASYISVDKEVLLRLGFNVVMGEENDGLRSIVWSRDDNKPNVLRITTDVLTDCNFLNHSFSDIQSVRNCLANAADR